ncbi:phosphopantetheine-binding protein [Anaerovibrio sp.]|uniref:phosphopantetheine-binding protein n=1 Tax=Anaerovibrio TaxID=82373 RepID=UPI0026245A37|nr:phosphopantetheine-binding protein [Anaerovibrio sp.]MCI7613589.1 phosphopantetheine-binding protein [Selenomonadaceae bacterium]MDD6598554.1 phosphopantetheine-binding protein [Anaerovibrio sp.]
MTKETFLEKMADILDAEEEISFDTELSGLEEWDSLSIVSYIAMANASCGMKVDVKKVREAVTIGDLYDLLQ